MASIALGNQSNFDGSTLETNLSKGEVSAMHSNSRIALLVGIKSRFE